MFNRRSAKSYRIVSPNALDLSWYFGTPESRAGKKSGNESRECVGTTTRSEYGRDVVFSNEQFSGLLISYPVQRTNVTYHTPCRPRLSLE